MQAAIKSSQGEGAGGCGGPGHGGLGAPAGRGPAWRCAIGPQHTPPPTAAQAPKAGAPPVPARSHQVLVPSLPEPPPAGSMVEMRPLSRRDSQYSSAWSCKQAGPPPGEGKGAVSRAAAGQRGLAAAVQALPSNLRVVLGRVGRVAVCCRTGRRRG